MSGVGTGEGVWARDRQGTLSGVREVTYRMDVAAVFRMHRYTIIKA